MSKTTSKIQARGGIRFDGVRRRGLEIFDQAPQMDLPSSTSTLSHDFKYSFEMGRAIPILCEEVMPGDVWNFSVENMLRLAPMIAPIMHNVDVQTYAFFVPERILYSDQNDWEAHIMGRSGEFEAEPAPGWAYFELTDGSVPVGSIGDYLGLNDPTSVGGVVRVKASPVAGYLKIWDDYFRTQQLAGETLTPLVPGNNSIYATITDFPPLRVGWMHDYFTAALPTPQTGIPVLIPLTATGLAPVVLATNSGTVRYEDGSLGNSSSIVQVTDGTSVSGDLLSTFGILKADTTSVVLNPNGTLGADVNTVANSIPDLRLAFRMQAVFEAMMRGGSRFSEWLLSMHRVQSSDARLQRAEYIGSHMQRMVISQVLSTAQTDVDTNNLPLGTMAGHGISYGGGSRFNFYAEEHGFVYVILAVSPETAYYGGIERKWFREDFLDYPIPMFGNINEQEILRREICIAITPEEQLETFGYIPRYAEMKYRNSRVAGEFKTSLNYWHMAREFDGSAVPTLNRDFVDCDPTKRIFAVEDDQNIFAQSYFTIYVKRNLPKFGVPTLM